MSDGLHVVCPHCDANNRLPAARLSDAPKCGKCGQGLFAGAPVALSGARFDRHVGKSDLPVIVDFWAAWCGPCKAIAPELEALAREVAGEALVVKVNTEELPEIAAQFQIQSIPTLMVFRNGRLAARRSGAAPRAELRRWLASSVAA